MQKVKILKDVDGSPDGITVIRYRKGEQHELNDSLVKGLFEQGACELVEKKEEKPTPKPKKATKKTNPVKENKKDD